MTRCSGSGGVSVTGPGLHVPVWRRLHVHEVVHGELGPGPHPVQAHHAAADCGYPDI